MLVRVSLCSFTSPYPNVVSSSYHLNSTPPPLSHFLFHCSFHKFSHIPFISLPLLLLLLFRIFFFVVPFTHFHSFLSSYFRSSSSFFHFTFSLPPHCLFYRLQVFFSFDSFSPSPLSFCLIAIFLISFLLSFLASSCRRLELVVLRLH